MIYSLLTPHSRLTRAKSVAAFFVHFGHFVDIVKIASCHPPVALGSTVKADANVAQMVAHKLTSDTLSDFKWDLFPRKKYKSRPAAKQH